MATFPETNPTPAYPLIVQPEWNTGITVFDSGTEQRRSRRLFPIFNVTVRYTALTQAQCQTLYTFFMARKGAYEAFYIYDLSLLNSHSFTHTGLYVGTGDGVEDTFDLPGRSTSAQVIYVAGVQQEVTTHYTILSGGGESSSDRVEFVTAPDDGAIITASFYGYLRMRVRFAQDTMDRELFTFNLYNFGLQLKGLQAA